ncbi:restriction endonuclease subunit S [Prevotella sp.]|uniref:restriction endonuclease subunit S n=1 Tax=Prevotella sp. TaxID=59823 RepID=UPI00307877D8
MSSYYEKLLATGEVKCIDEEVPFEIPASWSWARLTHVTYLIEDCPHSTAKDEGKGYPLVRTPNIGFGFLQLNGVHRVSEKVYNQRNVRAVPQKDDLIFAREAPAGNIAVIQNEKVCLGQRTVLLRPITDCILPQYLAYYVLAPSSQQNLVEKSSGTTVAHVNLSDFRPYLIAVPPIDEQKQIVNKLIELLSLIDKYNCYGDKLAKLNNEIYTLLKKSILQEAIQGKLVPQIIEDGTAYELLEQIKAEKQNLVKEGKLKKSALASSVIFCGDDNKYCEKSCEDTICIDDEIPFDIPVNWAWVRLDDICSFIHRGKSPKYSLIKKYPVVAQKCNQWSGFSIEKAKFIEPQSISSYKEEYILQDEDLMWNSTGLGTLGRMAIYYKKLNPYELAVADSHVTVIRPYKQYVISEYLYYYFASNTVQSVIEDKSDGSTKQKELSTKTVKSYLVPLPPMEEQMRIVEKVEELTQLLK